jgi:hypothetical protein
VSEDRSQELEGLGVGICVDARKAGTAQEVRLVRSRVCEWRWSLVKRQQNKLENPP